jgi:hypothetical protein
LQHALGRLCQPVDARRQDTLDGVRQGLGKTTGLASSASVSSSRNSGLPSAFRKIDSIAASMR